MITNLKLYFSLFIVLLVVFFISTDGFTQPKKHNSDYTQFRLLPGPPIPETDNPYSVVKQDFTITLRDNVVMDCAKFYPDQPNIYLPNGYPTVIMVHGYGDRKETLEGFASAQAQYNYVVYTYSVRGQGNSTGLSNLISTTEAQDLIEFVNYIRSDFSTGLDTSKILIMGGSQGGMVPYMAACMGGLNVKAIISSVTSPEFATSWIENGSVKMTLLWTVEYTSDTARYLPVVDRMSDWIYSNSKDKWDSLSYYLPLNRNFKNLVPNCKIPIMLENSWQDKFFNAEGNISSIPFLTSPTRYYFGAVMGHGGDTSGLENNWHMNFFNEWFYQYVWGVEQNFNTRPKFHYASTTYPTNSLGMWSFKHDSSDVWPPAGMTDVKLYFNLLNKMVTFPLPFINFLYYQFDNTVSSGFTLQNAVNLDFTGSEFNNKFKKSTVAFETFPLNIDVQMTGTPKLSLDYSSNADVCQYNFQIYEVSGNTAKLVNRINYTDRAYTTNQRKTKVVNGNAHSHIFRAGNKIRVVVTNLDTSPDDAAFFGTNPYVLPVMKNGKHKLFISNNSYISFPIKQITDSRVQIFAEKENEFTSKCEQFKLSQNYPNPFNPVTKISFSLPMDYNGLVTLKVYDITGREVSTLVNKIVGSNNGIFDVTFDGSKLASGVYFYRLTAGAFTDIKKMILVK